MVTATPVRRQLDTSQEVLNAMLTFPCAIQEAKAQGTPVVWSSILIPPELFRAMGVPVVSVEALSAIVSILQLSGAYCQITEETGYSRDVCAFQRCYMGCALADPSDMFVQSILVAPDLAVASNFPCMSSSKSFLFTVEHYRAPHYFLDTPIKSWGDEAPQEAVDYYTGQQS